jgi:hypothetical protein
MLIAIIIRDGQDDPVAARGRGPKMANLPGTIPLSKFYAKFKHPYLRLASPARMKAKRREAPMRAEWSMSEEELRGIILENLWTHRRKTIMFDHALEDLLIPIETKKSILKQLERGGLIRYTFEADTGLGSGDMTSRGSKSQREQRAHLFPLLFTNSFKLVTSVWKMPVKLRG